MKAILWSKYHCPFCDQAKALLKNRDIPFEEVKIDEDNEAREFILSKGHRAVPQIYYNGQLFVEGGFQGLSKLTEADIRQRMSTNLGTL